MVDDLQYRLSEMALMEFEVTMICSLLPPATWQMQSLHFDTYGHWNALSSFIAGCFKCGSAQNRFPSQVW